MIERQEIEGLIKQIGESSLSDYNDVLNLKNQLISIWSKIFTRVSFLGDAPYIFNDSDDYKVVLYSSSYENFRIFSNLSNSYIDYYFSKNTLYNLEDGFAIDFGENNDKAMLVIFGNVSDELFYQKSCDVFCIDNIINFENLNLSLFNCTYYINKSLNKVNIKNLYISNEIDIKYYNKYYNSDSFKFNVDNLYLLNSELENLDFMHGLLVKNLYFNNNPVLKFSFKEINVDNINIPEGVESLHLSHSSCLTMKKVSLPSTIKYIGEGSFSNTHIEELDTSYMDSYGIGLLAFNNSYIKRIDLKRCAYIAPSAFSKTSLCSLNLNLNTVLATSAFSECSSLSHVEFDDYGSLDEFNINKYRKNEYSPNFEKESVKKAIERFGYDKSHYYSKYDGNSYNLPVNLFFDCYFLRNINIPVNKIILNRGSIKGTMHGLKMSGYQQIDVYDKDYTLLSITNLNVNHIVDDYMFKESVKDSDGCLFIWSELCAVFYDMCYEKSLSSGRMRYKSYSDRFGYYDDVDESGCYVYDFTKDESYLAAMEIINCEIIEFYSDYFDCVGFGGGGYLLGYNNSVIGDKNKYVIKPDILVRSVISNLIRWGKSGNEENQKYVEFVNALKLHRFDSFSL